MGLYMFNTILSLASIAQQAVIPVGDVQEWAVSSYGPEISFNIKRKGKKIGTHEVTFEKINDELHVEAVTKIRVKFLFFNAYRFDYVSNEVWQNGNLISLISLANDNGKKSEVTIDHNSDLVKVKTNNGAFENSLGVPTYTTNHWNPNVLNAEVVLNTITGKNNSVEISQIGWDMVPTDNGERRAIHHQYDGELNNISSWYDEKWRWVGLNFKGKDGSNISYECNWCGDE